MSVTWTPQQLDDFKNRCSIQSSKSQPPVWYEPLAEGKGTPQGPRRIEVRITSFRSTLLDPDNLCVKGLVDGLRYNGIIPNDRAQDIELTVRQEKCNKKEARTEIEITYPADD